MTKSENKLTWRWAVFAVFVVFTYFFGLTVPLLGPDESRYSQVAREMFESGDWVTPTLGGFHWFEKPALLYWLQITFYHGFGVSEFAARFGSALFGLGTVGSLWLLGRRVSTDCTGEPHERAAKTVDALSLANILALVAASSLGLMVFSRGASFDIIVTFPLTAAMVAYFVFDQNERRSQSGFPFGLAIFYFFMGLAVLAKGLIGLLFPFAVVGMYHVISRRRPSRVFVLSVLWGIPISAAIVATWYLPMYLRHGWKFVDEFIIQHHFQRFTSNKYQHPQPFYFFWWVLPLMTFPWMPFFFGGAWIAAKRLIKKSTADSSETNLPFSPSPLLLFSLSWLLVPLAFFSFSGSKLPGYILPAVPPAIVLTAVCVWRLAQKRKAWSYAVIALGVGMLAVVFFTAIFALPRFAERDSVKPLITATDERGFGSQRVLMFYTLSHNAEFYAAGRLMRDEAGKQRVFYRSADLIGIIANEPNQAALIITPVEHLRILLDDARLNAENVRDNTDLAIVAVSLK